MNNALKALVAAACVAVLVVAGIWWSDRSAALEKAATMRDAKAEAEMSVTRIKCQSLTEAWDSGNKAYAEMLYGDQAARSVESCRRIIELSGYNTTKP